MRLAILSSHPIQYYAPLFRELARHIDLHVFFAHQPTPAQQAAAGFGAAFNWDIDLTSGYGHSFLANVAAQPDASRFNGCDTPEIGARLREGGFDAVLLFGWHLKFLLQGLWAAKLQGLPVLIRGDSHLGTQRSAPKKLAKEIFYPPFLRLFDVALYVGQRNRAYYEHYRYPADRLYHSPHCVDTRRFEAATAAGAGVELRRKLGVPNEERLVLFAGKLVEFKRPLDVIEAVARLRREGMAVSLMIAGSGPLDGQAKASANTLNVPLFALGFQNQMAMPAVYAAADVLALPSSAETWGLVCNEALACGTPIVTSSEVGCAPDLAADGAAGRVFSFADISDLSKALGSLLTAPPTVAAIRRKSDAFSLSRAAEGIIRGCELARRQPLSPTIASLN